MPATEKRPNTPIHPPVGEWIVLFLVTAMMCAVGWLFPEGDQGIRETFAPLGISEDGMIEVEEHSVRIHLNRADASLLEALPGIGPVRAQAILRLREELGEFTAVEELLMVHGIGEKTLEILRALVTLADT